MSETPPPAGSDTRFLIAAMALMVVVTVAVGVTMRLVLL